jgi:integrase
MSKLTTNVTLSVACDRYLTRIEAEGQSQTSIRTARYALARFQKAVATRRTPDPLLHTITPQMMDDYCYGTDGIRRGISAVSFNRYRSCLNQLFEYGIAMRWTDVNPMQAIGRARPDMPKSRLLLTAGELLALPDLCATPIQRVGVAIGENTGLRSNDICHLKIFDVSLAGGTIQTEIRKTRKLDVKPITLDLHRELDRWLDTYARLMSCEREELDAEWYLVPSYFIHPPRPNAPRDTVRKIELHPTRRLTNAHRLVQNPLAKLGHPTKQEGFHTLRRSSARVLFEMLREAGEGRDHALMIVQDYLNHSNVQQTQHYLGLNHERALRDTILRDRSFLSSVAESEQARVTGERVRDLHGRASASHKAM